MLKIKDLHVKKEKQLILSGVDMYLDKGKTYLLMGPNGSGKSSLSKAVAGVHSYEITKGEVFLDTSSLVEKTPEERVQEGIFISYQHPPEIPGLNISQYLRQIYNKKRNEKLSPTEFAGTLSKNLDLLNLSQKFKNRYLNEGFSGGEKKKMEILQMLLLKPKVAILDEIDSGVDIDALKLITHIIGQTQKENELTVLYITHYPSLLNLIEPTKIFLMKAGKIVKTGQQKLAETIQEEGYAKF